MAFVGPIKRPSLLWDRLSSVLIGGGAGRPGRYGAIASAWEDLGGFSLQALAQMAHQEG